MSFARTDLDADGQPVDWQDCQTGPKSSKLCADTGCPPPAVGTHAKGPMMDATDTKSTAIPGSVTYPDPNSVQATYPEGKVYGPFPADGPDSKVYGPHLEANWGPENPFNGSCNDKMCAPCDTHEADEEWEKLQASPIFLAHDAQVIRGNKSIWPMHRCKHCGVLWTEKVE